MDTLVEIGLRNAALAVLLALAAWLIGKALRRPALTHVLWVLVLLRLLAPPLWNVSIPRPALSSPAVAVVAPAPEADAEPQTAAANQSELELLAAPVLIEMPVAVNQPAVGELEPAQAAEQPVAEIA